MAMPSVRVSILRLMCVAVILTVALQWSEEHFQNALQDSQRNTKNDWPTTLPDESNRVHSLNGLSLIAPVGWIAIVSEDSLEITSSNLSSQRSEFVVREVHDPYRHQQPLPRTHVYQDTHACVKIIHARSNPVEPTCHEAHVIIERDSRQFEISFFTYKSFTGHIPQRIWNYLETFNLSEDKKTLTASLN